jgi:hypothetical protein
MSEPGSRVLDGGGAGLDHIAREIDAAIDVLERAPGHGPRLARLDMYRYCVNEPVREQM